MPKCDNLLLFFNGLGPRTMSTLTCFAPVPWLPGGCQASVKTPETTHTADFPKARSARQSTGAVKLTTQRIAKLKSKDGTGADLMSPSETMTLPEAKGVEQTDVTDTGDKYLEGYKTAIALVQSGQMPAFGTHILLGKLAPRIVRNAARNIEQGRTHPVQFICRKSG